MIALDLHHLFFCKYHTFPKKDLNITICQLFLCLLCCSKGVDLFCLVKMYQSRDGNLLSAENSQAVLAKQLFCFAPFLQRLLQQIEMFNPPTPTFILWLGTTPKTKSYFLCSIVFFCRFCINLDAIGQYNSQYNLQQRPFEQC